MKNEERISEQKKYITMRLLLHITDLLSEKELISPGESISIKKTIVQGAAEKEVQWNG